MALFGRWQEMGALTTIADVRAHFGVGDGLWAAFTSVVGGFNNDLRLLAAFPRSGLLGGCRQATFADGSIMFPVQATQIGLVWRLARRAIAFQSGMSEAEFQDVDPWQETVVQEAWRQSTTNTGGQGKGLEDVITH